MRKQLEDIQKAALETIQAASISPDLEALRVRYLGKKGELTAVLKQMGKLSESERPIMGQLANAVREALTEAIARQAGVMDYAPGFQLGHPLAFEAATAVASLMPQGLDRVFFTNSGSESVDTTLKIALAYHRARGEGQRTRLIGRERGYHGVGFGGISVGGISANRKTFSGALLPAVDHLPHTHNLEQNAYSKGQPAWGAHLADELERLVTLEMPFGKYKGRVIADLPGNYLHWFAREGFPPGRSHSRRSLYLPKGMRVDTSFSRSSACTVPLNGKILHKNHFLYNQISKNYLAGCSAKITLAPTP